MFLAAYYTMEKEPNVPLSLNPLLKMQVALFLLWFVKKRGYLLSGQLPLRKKTGKILGRSPFFRSETAPAVLKVKNSRERLTNLIGLRKQLDHL